MSDFVLSREDYERLPFSVNQFGVEDVEHVYPKNTGQAITELKARGLNADLALLERLARSGEVKPDVPDQWTRDDIDAAVYHLEKAGILTPQSVMLYCENVTAADYLAARRERAIAHVNKLGPFIDDELFFVKIITPRRTAGERCDITFQLRIGWEEILTRCLK